MKFEFIYIYIYVCNSKIRDFIYKIIFTKLLNNKSLQ